MFCPSSPVMKFPKLIAMRPTGKSVVKAKPNWGGKPDAEPGVVLNEDIMGISRKTIGRINADISSRLRVKAFMSLRRSALSTAEKPNLPRKPVLGAYTPRLMVMAGAS